MPRISSSTGVTGTRIVDASVADVDLTSPNNSTYKTLLNVGSITTAGLVAGTYELFWGLLTVVSGGVGLGALPLIYFDDADYTVSGLTQKLRVSAQVLPNSVAPGTISFTFGLYPVTVAGAATAINYTLGTLVPSSTAVIANPTASTPARGVSSDFTVPADGYYALGVVTSATIAATSVQALNATLQVRNV